jgi:hypothetical protein
MFIYHSSTLSPPNTRPIIGISSSLFVSFNLGDSGIGTGYGCE